MPCWEQNQVRHWPRSSYAYWTSPPESRIALNPAGSGRRDIHRNSRTNRIASCIHWLRAPLLWLRKVWTLMFPSHWEGLYPLTRPLCKQEKPLLHVPSSFPRSVVESTGICRSFVQTEIFHWRISVSYTH